MIILLKKIAAKTQIDKAIALTLLARIIQAVGGLGSIYFIAKYLSKDEQGYYYTFASILAIQVFFELGLTNILTQFTAHEFAHLELKNNTLKGNDYNKSRLSSLLHLCIKWFGMISIVLCFILILTGFIFFSSYDSKTEIVWRAPWVLLAVATSCNLFIDPILAYFDGLGFIKDISKVRLFQKASNVILLFVFFILGFKLYSAALASFTSIIINYLQIFFSNKLKILVSIWKEKSIDIVNYRKEIFPYQWRIGVSWISGYFIFQLINPVLFAKEGPVIAGQVGMTFQVLNGIAALSMSWISTKIPLFSTLISQKKYNELDLFFNETIKNVLLVNFALLVTFLIGIQLLQFCSSSLINRFVPFYPLLLLSASTFLNQLVFSWATYLRCHKKEPLLVQSMVSAIYCTCCIMLLGVFYNLLGFIVLYTIWGIVSVFWVHKIFIHSKLVWHTAITNN